MCSLRYSIKLLSSLFFISTQKLLNNKTYRLSRFIFWFRSSFLRPNRLRPNWIIYRSRRIHFSSFQSIVRCRYSSTTLWSR